MASEVATATRNQMLAIGARDAGNEKWNDPQKNPPTGGFLNSDHYEGTKSWVHARRNLLEHLPSLRSFRPHSLRPLRVGTTSFGVHILFSYLISGTPPISFSRSIKSDAQNGRDPSEYLWGAGPIGRWGHLPGKYSGAPGLGVDPRLLTFCLIKRRVSP